MSETTPMSLIGSWYAPEYGIHVAFYPNGSFWSKNAQSESMGSYEISDGWYTMTSEDGNQLNFMVSHYEEDGSEVVLQSKIGQTLKYQRAPATDSWMVPGKRVGLHGLDQGALMQLNNQEGIIQELDATALRALVQVHTTDGEQPVVVNAKVKYDNIQPILLAEETEPEPFDNNPQRSSDWLVPGARVLLNGLTGHAFLELNGQEATVQELDDETSHVVVKVEIIDGDSKTVRKSTVHRDNVHPISNRSNDETTSNNSKQKGSRLVNKLANVQRLFKNKNGAPTGGVQTSDSAPSSTANIDSNQAASADATDSWLTPGKRVILHSLKGALMHLNDQEGVILELDMTTSRAVVQVRTSDDGDHNETTSINAQVKYENIRPCAEQESEKYDNLQSGRTDTEPESNWLVPGARVLLNGLTGHAFLELNGQEATVQELDDETSRVVVKVEIVDGDNKTVRTTTVHQDNVHPISHRSTDESSSNSKQKGARLANKLANAQRLFKRKDAARPAGGATEIPDSSESQSIGSSQSSLTGKQKRSSHKSIFQSFRGMGSRKQQPTDPGNEHSGSLENDESRNSMELQPQKDDNGALQQTQSSSLVTGMQVVIHGMDGPAFMDLNGQEGTVQNIDHQTLRVTVAVMSIGQTGEKVTRKVTIPQANVRPCLPESSESDTVPKSESDEYEVLPENNSSAAPTSEGAAATPDSWLVPGKSVRLHNLNQGAFMHLNNQKGTIQELDAASSRAVVQVRRTDGNKTTFVKANVKYENIQPIINEEEPEEDETIQRIPSEKKVETNSSSPADWLVPGARVLLNGMTGHAFLELNGQEATVQELDEAASRVVVKVEIIDGDNKTVRTTTVHQDNVHPITNRNNDESTFTASKKGARLANKLANAQRLFKRKDARPSGGAVEKPDSTENQSIGSSQSSVTGTQGKNGQKSIFQSLRGKSTRKQQPMDPGNEHSGALESVKNNLGSDESKNSMLQDDSGALQQSKLCALETGMQVVIHGLDGPAFMDLNGQEGTMQNIDYETLRVTVAVMSIGQAGEKVTRKITIPQENVRPKCDSDEHEMLPGNNNSETPTSQEATTAPDSWLVPGMNVRLYNLNKGAFRHLNNQEGTIQELDAASSRAVVEVRRTDGDKITFVKARVKFENIQPATTEKETENNEVTQPIPTGMEVEKAEDIQPTQAEEKSEIEESWI